MQMAKVANSIGVKADSGAGAIPDVLIAAVIRNVSNYTINKRRHIKINFGQMSIYKSTISILIIMTLLGCKVEKKEIITHNQLRNYLNQDNFPESFKDYFQCDSIILSINQNVNFSYEQSIKNLKVLFDDIDQNSSNKKLNNFIKSLVVADFVYASFSYRFLGDSLGIDNDSSIIKKWDTLSLKKCFDIGNHNHAAIYCNNRTSFYVRLLDTLLSIKTEIIEIEGVHTFPLTFIDDERFLIDPYDPFVVYDSISKVVLAYDSIRNNPYKQIIRSKRLFGCSRELVSNPLLQKVGIKYNVCSLMEYLKKIGEQYIKNDSLLLQIHIPNFSDISKIRSNQRFSYSLALCSRPEGNIRLEQFYFK